MAIFIWYTKKKIKSSTKTSCLNFHVIFLDHFKKLNVTLMYIINYSIWSNFKFYLVLLEGGAMLKEESAVVLQLSSISSFFTKMLYKIINFLSCYIHECSMPVLLFRNIKLHSNGRFGNNYSCQHLDGGYSNKKNPQCLQISSEYFEYQAFKSQ